MINPIEKYVEEHQKELFEDLKYIVSFPSVKGPAEPDAPFGRACADCLAACVELFRKNGFDAVISADGTYALAYLGARPEEAKDGYTGIFGHADVVPVTPEEWVLTTPFALKEHNDLVIGRGVNDDKDAVIGSLYILRAIRDLQIPLAHPITVFIGMNEETGMADIKNFKKQHISCLPKVAVVPDSAFPVSFGERGSFHADVRSNEPLSDILAIEGGSAYNIVMAGLKCTVRSLPGLKNFLKDSGSDWLDITDNGETLSLVARGIPCHGSRPYLGESALLRLMKLFSGFSGFKGTDREIIAQTYAILCDCLGNNLGLADDDPYMGRLTMGNGIVKLADGHLFFTLDIRFGPGVNREAKKADFVAAVAKKGFTATTSKGSVSFRLDENSTPARAFLDAYRKYSGNPDATYFYMSGGTYSKHLYPECSSFSTGMSLGKYIDRLGLPAGHGKCHESDECLGKPEFIRGIGVLGGIVLELDKSY